MTPQPLIKSSEIVAHETWVIPYIIETPPPPEVDLVFYFPHFLMSGVGMIYKVIRRKGTVELRIENEPDQTDLGASDDRPLGPDSHLYRKGAS